MVSQNAGYFVNTMFGWPMVPSADMPGGGPAYPLSALGVRVRAHPTDSITVLAGVFNGSPVAEQFRRSADAQSVRHELSAQRRRAGDRRIAVSPIPSFGTLVQADEAEPLARTYKIGFWYDSESFADLRYDNTGLSLANPASNGNPGDASRRLRDLRRRRPDDLSLRTTIPTATSTSSSGRWARRSRTAT